MIHRPVLVLLLLCIFMQPVFAAPFKRGDGNSDEVVDISDMLFTLGYLFTGGPGPDCEDRADINDDGVIEISDPIYGLGFLFLGTPPPPPPGPFSAGFDPTLDTFDCGDNRSPSSGFVAVPATGQAPLEVTFDATSSTDLDAEIAAYEWDFGDGEGGTGAVLTHTFTTPGSYTVSLTVFDTGGNTSSKSSQVLVTPGAPSVTVPDSPTQANFITLEGTTAAGYTVRIVRQQGLAITEGTASETGAFSVDVALEANTINEFLITAIDSLEQTSPPTGVEVLNDNEAPLLFVDEPALDSEVTNESVTILGRVSDRLSGYQGLDVTVNGVPAAVIIGIGTNGTFELSNVPLSLGLNTITVEARDALDNTLQKEHRVTRVAIPDGVPTITVLGGNSQTGQVGSTLSAPITVELKDSFGEPFSGKLATFEVVRSDGRLSTSSAVDAERSRILQVRTNAGGLASIYWTLGNDAGCGNNRISVTSTSVVGTTTLCATALPAPPDRILIGSGNNQRVEAGAVAPESLKVWVSDGCNGTAGASITFAVTGGSGTFETEGVTIIDGSPVVTVETTETGHAEVPFRLGHEPGNHVVEATFSGNAGRPATFVSFAVVRQEDQPTSFSGLVVDNSQQPIGGAECHLSLPGRALETTTSDAQGHFEFPDLPASGPAIVYVNGLEATGVGGRTVPPGSFPVLNYDVVLVPNAANGLPTPVRLPRLDPVNAQTYDGSADVVLGIFGIDGLGMVVKAGSVTLADGQRPGPESPVTLALNQVHRDDIPMPMPDGASPPFAWTLHPAGATFDPPVEIIYPNMSGLPAGAAAFFLSFDHETSQFEIVATGQVTADGAAILSDPGVGIRKAGWGASFPPASATGDVENCAGSCDDNNPCTEDTCVNNECVHVENCNVTGVLSQGNLFCLPNLAVGNAAPQLTEEVVVTAQTTLEDCPVMWGGDLGTHPQMDGNTFRTRYAMVGEKMVTATCGDSQMAVSFHVVQVEIEIDNTPADPDDLVRLRCQHPNHLYKTSCRARVQGNPTSDLPVELVNPDNRLRFSMAELPTLPLVLPQGGMWVPFEVSGSVGSDAINDTRIQARRDTAAGALCAEEDLTVFHFGNAALTLTAENIAYRFAADNKTYAANGIRTTPACSFEGHAEILPAGVDCNTTKIVDLVLAFMQHVTRFDWETTWENPNVAWLQDAAGQQIAPAGHTVRVPTTKQETGSFDPAVPYPVTDSVKASDFPLYDTSLNALHPPLGCGGMAVKSFDSPWREVFPTHSETIDYNGVPAATVTWQRRVSFKVNLEFETFLVLHDMFTADVCAQRQASWSLNLDDTGVAAAQRAVVTPDIAAISDPAQSLPTANAALQFWQIQNSGVLQEFVAP